jgi:DNA-binding transcriptional MocR family regulator
MKRYEALATDIEDSIRTGVLRAGDRLASVRHTSASRGVSPSTVFQAYYLLEARGLVQARERSGYFVAPGMGQRAPEPDLPSQPHEGSVAVDVSERVFEILESSRTREVVPFGSAFPSPLLFPLARLGQCMAAAAQSLDPWSTVDDLSPGHEPLRSQIALRYLVAGMPLHHDEIVVTNGALEALNLCLSVVTRPGDAVVVESPTFYAALQALERLNLQALEIATHPRDGIDLAALAEALERQPPHQPIKACWLMPSFQNPLGSLMPEGKKSELVALLARHGVPLIEDDVYGELHYGPQRPPPAKAFDGTGLVMHCSSFSKSLAPGYRVGWVAAGRFATAVQRLKLMTTLSAATPSQQALSEYLAQGGYDRHLRALRRSLEQQQAIALAAVAQHFPRGTRVSRPEGGYFLWAELPPQVDALALHRQALAQGISLAPGQIFSADRRFAHCLRINYGHPAHDRLQPALECVGRLATVLAAEGARTPLGECTNSSNL